MEKSKRIVTREYTLIKITFNLCVLCSKLLMCPHCIMFSFFHIRVSLAFPRFLWSNLCFISLRVFLLYVLIYRSVCLFLFLLLLWKRKIVREMNKQTLHQRTEAVFHVSVSKGPSIGFSPNLKKKNWIVETDFNWYEKLFDWKTHIKNTIEKLIMEAHDMQLKYLIWCYIYYSFYQVCKKPWI